MAWKNLQDFIQKLEQLGELKRISAPVDWHLEISEIADRVMKSEGPALLFEKVKDSQVPLAINLFGTEKRMALALEVDALNDVARRIEELIEIPKPTGLMEKLSLIPKLAEVAKFPPRTVLKGPCQEVIKKGEEASLLDLPILHCWPKDAGRYITLGSVITKNPQTGQRNVGLYRLQVAGSKTLLMHWQLHKDANEHYRKGDGKMPVAIALGADPATMYSASAPLPEGIDELLFAGFLRKEPVPVLKCVTVDLEVPAESEIVIEGYVDLNAPKQMEGPFGDHTGYYSLAEPYPAMHVTAITRRESSVYPTTIVGIPPMEDLWLGKATERIFLPLVRKMVPEIVDMNFPAEGIFNNACIISIKKEYPGQARKVAHGLWGLGQLTFTKVLIIVDEWVDVQNVSQVAWLAFMNIDPKRDCFTVEGPVDTLNHASSEWNYGSKMGVDATTKSKEEGHTRGWPDVIEMTPEVKEQVTRRWKEYGV